MVYRSLKVQSSEFGVRSFKTRHSELRTKRSELHYIIDKEESMPRREKDRVLARRRKRNKERKKLQAKELSKARVGAIKESEKKKPERAPAKETPQESVEKPPSEA